METTTSLETVDVIFPFSTQIFQSMIPRPMYHETEYTREAMKQNGYIRVNKKNESIIWEENGFVTKVLLKDSTKYVWYPRPTLSDVVNMDASTWFTQFHPDGTVTQRCGYINYIWGPKKLSAEYYTVKEYPYFVEDYGYYPDDTCYIENRDYVD